MQSRITKSFSGIGLFLIMVVAVRAEEAETTIASAEGVPPFQPVKQVADEVKKLGDWDGWYELIEPQLDGFWSDNEWDSEADRFALEMIQDVAEIPPWEFNKRLNTALGALRDRYGLDDEQYMDLQSRTYGMIGAMAWRHGGTMLRHVKEMVDTRRRGEPFTAEQVARWSKEGTPIFEDAHRMFERVAKEYAEKLSSEQRATFERDWESYQRRKAAIERLRKRWMEGKWAPGDWGLDHDPLHALTSEERAILSKRADAARELNLPESPMNESMWERYVRRFIQRYHLDDAQATAAWSILREIQGRADDFRRVHLDRQAPVLVQERAVVAIESRLDKLFDELKSRLNVIPTTIQRRYADVVPATLGSDVRIETTSDGEPIPPE